MQKGIFVSVAALLAACGGSATTNSSETDSTAPLTDRANVQKAAQIGFQRYDQGGMAGCFDPNLSGYARAAAERIGGVPCEETSQVDRADSDAWIGEYQGPAVEGMTGTVSVERGTGANRYRVGVDVFGSGCSGGVGGVGVVSGNRMNLSVRVPDSAEQCRITLDRSGASLRVSEVEGCLYFHGAQCRFDANVSRQRSASTAPQRPPVAAASSARPWIVGAWVPRGGSCDGEGLIVGADGDFMDGGDSGTWALLGNALTFTALSRTAPGGGLGEEEPISNPRPERYEILAHTPRAFSMRGANGRVSNMVRCR
jgi:hypothetical protein